jgi:phosphoenolpyruvate-protein kinase (PTS system EI component)
LNDEVLIKEIRKEIFDNLITASSAVKNVFLRWERRFLLMESHIARDKSDDMQDISKRLRNALEGITLNPLENIPKDCVLVTSHLLPSDTVFLSNYSIKAILLEHGTFGSHSALFTRQMGIPCISGISDLMSIDLHNALAFVDADTGVVIVNPDKHQKSTFQNKIKNKAKITEQAKAKASCVAITKDDKPIAVLANVGCRKDVEQAVQNGADGIGLYRIEQAYLGRAEPPDVADLLTEMQYTLEPAEDFPITVRLLDVGADKPLPYLDFFSETNPALGRRGIRLLREYPELLITQLEAILLLHKKYNIQILIPMVTTLEDILSVSEALDKLSLELGITAQPKLGAMIETPASALSVKIFSKHVDFLSFGTNDLTQYTCAADRDNSAIEKYFDDASEVIFRLMQIVHYDLPDMALSLCGELAGRVEYTSKILQCGIKSLSVPAPLIPIVKETIRNSRCVEVI